MKPNSNYATNADLHFTYEIHGTWNKTTRTAQEVFSIKGATSAANGTVTSTHTCDFDPWLDPDAVCTFPPNAPAQQNNNIKGHHFWDADDGNSTGLVVGPLRLQHSRQVSASSSSSRNNIIWEAMERSLKIIDPTPGKHFNDPSAVMVTTVMDRVVENPPIVGQTINILGYGTIGSMVIGPQNPVKSGNVLFTYFPLKDIVHSYAMPYSYTVDLSFRNSTPIDSVKFTINSYHRLKILSPQAGQEINGDVVVKLDLANHGSTNMPVELDWTWSPFSEPGSWPPIPKDMNIRPTMYNDELVIPRSAFTEEGIWSLTATLNISKIYQDQEGLSISDRVSFKIKGSTPMTDQLHLPPTAAAHAKIKPTATLPTEKQQVKPFKTTAQAAPTTALKAPQSVEPQTKVLQNRPIAAAISAPKAPPTIIRPQENQRFDKPGPVQISARVSAADAGLVWDVEYQAFNASSFVRQRQPSAGSLAAGGGTVKMARLTFPAPGTYRFRAKEEGDQARWSPWRTIVVGSPPALAPAARNIKLTAKPELSTKPKLPGDAVKAAPVTEEAPTAAPIRQVPTGVTPSAIKPNAVPKIKPLP
ncbi:hypothetical protein [Desulfofustis glycolicus]|nr:hypothetical protein [Desulfofustis glycolicus]MCB2214936.1 hypothetical protein [Desulfobulbaceae bacterium]